VNSDWSHYSSVHHDERSIESSGWIKERTKLEGEPNLSGQCCGRVRGILGSGAEEGETLGEEGIMSNGEEDLTDRDARVSSSTEHSHSHVSHNRSDDRRERGTRGHITESHFTVHGYVRHLIIQSIFANSVGDTGGD